jgi:hypothetical protein
MQKKDLNLKRRKGLNGFSMQGRSWLKYDRHKCY